MSTEKPCPNCGGTGWVLLPTQRTIECSTCDGTGIDLAHQLDVIVEDAKAKALAGIEPTTALEAHRERYPDRQLTVIHGGVPTVIPRMAVPDERVDEIDEHALVEAFREMAGKPIPPEATTERQREAIGRTIAEFITGAVTGAPFRSGEHADSAARRIVAALGPIEAHFVADYLGRWASSLATVAEKAERLGLKR